MQVVSALSEEVLAQRLETLASAPYPGAAEVSDLRWQYREAAAVLSYFEWKDLKPRGSPDPDGTAYQYLLNDISLKRTAAGEFWILNGNVRRDALKRLGNQQTLRSTLEAYSPRSQDPLQKALDAYILQRPWALEGLSVDELQATLEVAIWLQDIVPGLPPRSELRRRLNSAYQLQPLRELVESGLFFGRDSENSYLQKYLAAGPSSSLYLTPPLFVHAPAGAGKSVLVAKFILDCMKRNKPDRPLFVYFDLRRPGLIEEEPLTLLREAAKQLAIQMDPSNAAWDDFKELFSEWSSGKSTDEEVSNRLPAISIGERAKFLSHFHQVLSADARPLLWVFDNFEEATERGTKFLRRLWMLLNELQALYPKIRYIKIGRALPDALPAEPYPLKGLDPESAEDLLNSLGVTDPQRAQEIAEKVDRNPLLLRLAAKLVQRPDTDPAVLEGHKERMQASLYWELIARIPNPQVRKLARLSFVPRELTPDILRNVVASPAGIDLGEADAARLFTELRGELLLATFGQDALRHPPDLRMTMLAFARRTSPERVRAIHQLAETFYRRQMNEPARVEELYHQLSLGEMPPTSKKALRALRSSIDDLPSASQIYLAEKLDLKLAPSVRKQAAFDEWVQSAEAAARKELRQNRPKRALAALVQRADRGDSPVLCLLEARAQAQLGDLASARKIVQQALNSGATVQTPMEADLLICLAEFEVKEADLESARRLMRRAYSIAQAIDDDERLIECGVRRLQLREALAVGLDTKLVEEIRGAWAAVTDAQLKRRQDLLWEAAVFLGDDHPDMIARAVQLVRVPKLSTARLKQFSKVLAQAAIAVPGTEPSPSQVALAQRWEQHLRGANATPAEAVARFLEAKPTQTQLRNLINVLRAVLLDNVAPDSVLSLLDLHSSPSTLLARHQEQLRDVLTVAYRSIAEADWQALPGYVSEDLGLDWSLPPQIADAGESIEALVQRVIDEGRLKELFAAAAFRYPSHEGLATLIRRYPRLGELTERDREGSDNP
jgi:hypothetical protein